MSSSTVKNAASSDDLNAHFEFNTHYYVLTWLALLGILGCIPFEQPMLAFAFFVLGAAGLILVDLRAVFILAYPLYALSGALFSLVVIEQGAYLTEQFRMGFNAGATAPLGAFALSFLTVAHAGIVWSLGRRPWTQALSSAHLVRTVVITSVASALFYVAAFAISGIGLSYPTRFEWVQSLTPQFQVVHRIVRSFVIPSAFGLIGVYLAVESRRSSRLLTALLPIVALVLTGEKFSGFLIFMLMAACGFGIGHYLSAKRLVLRPRLVLLSAVAVIALAVSVVQGYERMGSRDLARTLEQRVALQGHVWFGIFDRYDGDPALAPSAVFGKNSLADPAGLDLLSYLVSNPSFVHDRLDQGITFTMGGPPSVLAAFGLLPGLLVYALMGMAYVLVARVTVACLTRNSPIVAAAGFTSFALVAAATQQGGWDALYGPVGIAAALVIAIRMVSSASRKEWNRDNGTQSRSHLGWRGRA